MIQAGSFRNSFKSTRRKPVSEVLYEKKNRIAYITLNRPQKLNAIDRLMNRYLHEIWVDFKKDENVWVAIISGEGRNFCAGFDLNVFREEIKQDKYNWSKSAMFGNLRSTPNEHQVFKPIITAAQGTVNGMGTWLMLQGDIRIAAEETYVALGEARLNFPVEFSALLTRLMPFSIASELLYTAKPMKARRLFEIGVINRIVAEEELMPTAEKVARDICQCGQQSLRVMKELVIKGQYLDYAAAVSLTGELVVPVVNSDATRKAIGEFVDRKEVKKSG
jgi:enoyl-CoA hydratase/carnithine racemase